MKRLLFFAFILFLLPAAQAQTPDEVIISSDELQYDGDVAVSPSLRQLQTHPKRRTEYSSFFLEATMSLQENGTGGVGFNFAFTPYRIGGYTSWTAYNRHTTLTGGLVIRPLAGIVRTDWQLFGGAAYAMPIDRPFEQPLGFEIGTRFGADADANGGKFAWWSLSLSRLYVNHTVYYTLGLSLNLAGLIGVWVVL
jgi:hypothetical protein